MSNEAGHVDVQVDALMSDDEAQVDWDQVTEAEASSYSLAMSVYRDVSHTHAQRRVAWGTATGGVLSMGVLALVCILCGSGPWFALSIILASQTIRALWLYWKAHQASQDVHVMAHQAHQVVKELAAVHPAHR